MTPNCCGVDHQRLRSFLLAITEVLFLIELEFGLKFAIQNVGLVTNDKNICVVFQSTENLNEVVNTLGVKR
jgi:hypothetical protein